MNDCPRIPRSGRAVAGAVILLATLAAVPAHAQQPPPTNDSVTQIARQRYNEGVKAYDAGKFEDARTAFLQAYALKHHPAVLLNLGQSELRSGHFEDAGNHFQQFLREFSSATPEERATAEKGIAEAKKKASLLVVSVDAAGADVSIDGVTMGRSPFYDPIFVKPGNHTVYAVLGGKSAAVAVESKVGMASTATLTLGLPGTAPPPVPVAPPPVMPPPVTPPGPPVTPPGPPMTPPGPPMTPPGMGPPLPGPEPQPLPGGHESFFHWYTRKPIAWVGTGVAGLGLIMGIAGGSSALSASNAASSVGCQIKNHYLGLPDNGPCPTSASHVPAVCGDTSGNGVTPGYEAACSTLRSNVNLYHTDIAVTATGWVLFGLGVAGTAIYTFVDWYPNRDQGADTAPPPRVSVVPMVGPTGNGIGLVGTF